MPINNTIKTLTEKLEAAREAIQREGQEALKLAFKGVFDACPSLKAIRWPQYTSFWNDGDACEFYVRDFEVKFSDTPDDGGDHEDGFEHVSSLEQYNAEYMKTPEAKRAIEALREIHNAPDDIFLFTFGDHVQVTATRDGFDVEEYDHE